MLVWFHKGIILEGENTVTDLTKKSFWGKKVEKRQKIYCTTGVSGICDESEVEKEIERLTTWQLGSSGWGKDFSGWQRVVPYEEYEKIIEEKGWSKNCLPKKDPKIEYIYNWKMEKILKELTGLQFAQFLVDILKGD